MAVPSYEDARRVIRADRERKIAGAIWAAWDDWETCPDRGKYSRWPRTRANMVFERVADHLIDLFAGDGGVRFVFMDETIKIIFDELIVLRVKKANALGLGNNVATQRDMHFTDAQPDIPGLNGLKKLEVVYVLNELQTEVRSVVMQARDGDMKLYSYPIDAASEGMGTVLPFPTLPPVAPTTERGDYADTLVHMKKPADEKRGDEPKPE